MEMISREERLKLIVEYRSSGLTQAEWCRLQDIKTSKLCRLI